MITKIFELKVNELERRVQELERRNFSFYQRNDLDEIQEKDHLLQQKKVRNIFLHTYGIISKKRGIELIKMIEQGRRAWK
jgi:hypothetical protein